MLTRSLRRVKGRRRRSKSVSMEGVYDSKGTMSITSMALRAKVPLDRISPFTI